MPAGRELVWELGVELHQNESQATESIKEARAICSWVTLDAKALCFTTIKEAKAMCSHVTLDAKALCLVMVKEAKMTQAHTIQEAEAACSMAIRDAEIWKASQAKLLQREHGKVMLDLEAQAIQEEGRSQADFLSTCQAASVCQPSRAQRHAGGFLPCFIGADHLCLTHLPYHKGPLQWRNSPLQLLLLHQCPSSLLGPKDGTFPQILWRACLWAEPHPR